MAADAGTSRYSYRDAEGDEVECFPVQLDEAVLKQLISDIYQQYWDRIHFGTLIQGAVWEIAVDQPPVRIGMLDGISRSIRPLARSPCIGGTKEPRRGRSIRRSRQAAPYVTCRILSAAQGRWGTEFMGLPDVQRFRRSADDRVLPESVSRPRAEDSASSRLVGLDMWDDLRRRYAGYEPDPSDRLSTGFVHG